MTLPPPHTAILRGGGHLPIGAWSPTDPDELPGEPELPDLANINSTEPAF